MVKWLLTTKCGYFQLYRPSAYANILVCHIELREVYSQQQSVKPCMARLRLGRHSSIDQLLTIIKSRQFERDTVTVTELNIVECKLICSLIRMHQTGAHHRLQFSRMTNEITYRHPYVNQISVIYIMYTYALRKYCGMYFT